MLALIAARHATKASARSSAGSPTLGPASSSTAASISRLGSSPLSSVGTARSTTASPPNPSNAKPSRSSGSRQRSSSARAAGPRSSVSGNSSACEGSGPGVELAAHLLEDDALVHDVLVEEEDLVLGGRHDEGVLHLAEHAAEAARPRRARPASWKSAACSAAMAPAGLGGARTGRRRRRAAERRHHGRRGAAPRAARRRPSPARRAAGGSGPRPWSGWTLASTSAGGQRDRPARPAGSGRAAAAGGTRRAPPAAARDRAPGRPLTITTMSSRPPRVTSGGLAHPRHAHAVLGRGPRPAGARPCPSPTARRCAGAGRPAAGRRQRGAAVVGHAQLHAGMRQRQLRRRCAGSPPARWSAVLRNFRRAGVLKNRSWTSTRRAGLGRHREPLAHDAALAGQAQPLGGAARAARRP